MRAFAPTAPNFFLKYKMYAQTTPASSGASSPHTSSPATLSSISPFAVSMMMGVRTPCARALRSTSRPSMPGIMMSNRGVKDPLNQMGERGGAAARDRVRLVLLGAIGSFGPVRALESSCGTLAGNSTAPVRRVSWIRPRAARTPSAAWTRSSAACLPAIARPRARSSVDRRLPRGMGGSPAGEPRRHRRGRPPRRAPPGHFISPNGRSPCSACSRCIFCLKSSCR